MSSGFATKVKHGNASLDIHKAQLEDTQASLAKIERRHVFPLMDVPEELRKIILVMVVHNEMRDAGLTSMGAPRGRYALTYAGNKQLRLETILAVLQNVPVCLDWDPQRTENWLSTVNFGVLQQAGITSTRDGFSAVRTVDFTRYSLFMPDEWKIAARMLKRFENLHEMIVQSCDADRMFNIGFYDISGDELGEKMRFCNLDLPAFDVPSLRRLTVTVVFNDCYARENLEDRVAAEVPEWKTIIEHGCQKVAGWLREEYSARGMRVTVDIQTQLDDN